MRPPQRQPRGRLFLASDPVPAWTTPSATRHLARTGQRRADERVLARPGEDLGDTGVYLLSRRRDVLEGGPAEAGKLVVCDDEDGAAEGTDGAGGVEQEVAGAGESRRERKTVERRADISRRKRSSELWSEVDLQFTKPVSPPTHASDRCARPHSSSPTHPIDNLP